MQRIGRQWLACLVAPLMAWGCGSDVKLGSGTSKPSSSGQAGAGSGDATADKDHNPAFLATIATPAATACQKAGMVYIWRLSGCSTTLTLATFPCDRAGITAAFAPTGYQIDQALVQALGAAGNAADPGDGYVIDQCGESPSGERYVDLVKKDVAGVLHVREIDANL